MHKCSLCRRATAVTFVYCVATAKDVANAIIAMESWKPMRVFEWYHFQWPAVTSNPDFKIMPLFDANYRHSYHGILIWTYTCPTTECHLEWPQVILSDLVKFSWHEAWHGLSATTELLVIVCALCIGHDLVHGHLVLSPQHLGVSAARHRSQPRSTSVALHATWTANTSLRSSQSMATSSRLKCRRIATIRSSLVDMLTLTTSPLMMLTKLCSIWTEVEQLFL